MTTLVSFLGRASQSEGPDGRLRPGYRKTRYRFADGAVSDETAYAGIALRRRLDPDRLVLLGTSGSMWDVFLEEFVGSDDDALEDLLELTEAAAEDRVDGPMLERHVERLAAALELAPGRVECRVIGRADDLAGQVAILDAIAQAVPPNARLALDVTHGYRHLPMLALVAARYLARVRGVEIEALHYAAFEMRDAEGVVPVLELGGLLSMLDWIEGLALYDGSGDYRRLAGLLAAEGLAPAVAEQMEHAAHLERVNNAADAQRVLYTQRQALDSTDLSPLGELFRPELDRRLAWTRERNDGSREYALAEAYLGRQDYLRAAVLMREGTVTRWLHADKSFEPHARKERERAEKWLSDRGERFREFWEVADFRNALAHGTPPRRKDVRRYLEAPEKLHARLERLLETLRALDFDPAD